MLMCLWVCDPKNLTRDSIKAANQWLRNKSVNAAINFIANLQEKLSETTSKSYFSGTLWWATTAHFLPRRLTPYRKWPGWQSQFRCSEEVPWQFCSHHGQGLWSTTSLAVAGNFDRRRMTMTERQVHSLEIWAFHPTRYGIINTMTATTTKATPVCSTITAFAVVIIRILTFKTKKIHEIL